MAGAALKEALVGDFFADSFAVIKPDVTLVKHVTDHKLMKQYLIQCE